VLRSGQVRSSQVKSGQVRSRGRTVGEEEVAEVSALMEGGVHLQHRTIHAPRSEKGEKGEKSARVQSRVVESAGTV
jgi:hypothetical protein